MALLVGEFDPIEDQLDDGRACPQYNSGQFNPFGLRSGCSNPVICAKFAERSEETHARTHSSDG